MPPFAQSKGGMLTDQADRRPGPWNSRLGRADVPSEALPPFAAPSPGDAQRGAASTRRSAPPATARTVKGSKGGSAIANGAYLALVSDQYLRTVVIAGRPELGAPDWRGDVAGRPMTSEEISDVVAWLASQRSTQRSTSK